MHNGSRSLLPRPELLCVYETHDSSELRLRMCTQVAEARLAIRSPRIGLPHNLAERT